VAISVDPSAVTREHVGKLGVTYTFLSDPGAKVIRRYGLLHAVSPEQQIARPGEFLIDPTGTVRWRDLTEDYRVRARPESVIEAFDGLK
jgi:peroxiredoxin